MNPIADELTPFLPRHIQVRIGNVAEPVRPVEPDTPEYRERCDLLEQLNAIVATNKSKYVPWLFAVTKKDNPTHGYWWGVSNARLKELLPEMKGE